MKEELLDMCVDIYAHLILDQLWNGTNSSEASNVADRVLEIIGESIDNNFKQLAKQKADELDPNFEYHSESSGLL
jgi:hypothetical protein